MPDDATAIDAAAELVAVQMALARRGLGLAQAALAGARRIETLRHYPRGDVIDTDNRSQFYYHLHRSSRCPPEEHGHFHLFTRRPDGGFSHLAGLSLDDRGWPIRWFTTNRWVTGETWLAAPALCADIDRFAPRTAGRLAPVARWLGAMVRLHRDSLKALLRRRDAVVARQLQRRKAEDFFEDRRHDVLTEQRIDLAHTLSRLAGTPPPTPGDN
ncbi:hypothetical protein KAK06_17780 [Ideonella sp. 4Y11]|uniref:DUF6969 domain-containing protein n=1 Tax=Ideonella aquatica TaxID=2824119 RepID=A0A941BMG2_9BURK|nr:hypothetical protein [Ideonella aquatica]MBQ0960809.1 hypothetical protein [Ideonella aquatica]